MFRFFNKKFQLLLVLVLISWIILCYVGSCCSLNVWMSTAGPLFLFVQLLSVSFLCELCCQFLTHFSSVWFVEANYWGIWTSVRLRQQVTSFLVSLVFPAVLVTTTESNVLFLSTEFFGYFLLMWPASSLSVLIHISLQINCWEVWTQVYLNQNCVHKYLLHKFF